MQISSDSNRIMHAKKAMRRERRGLKKHRLMDWVRRLLLPGASGGR
jgi:hypothetical protein